jgi:hypothetical protein
MSAIGLRLLGLGQSKSRAPYTADEAVVLLVAALAFISGLIQAGSAVERLHQAYAPGLALLAAVQISWALVITSRRSQGTLLFGCALYLGVVGLAIVSPVIGVRTTSGPWTPSAATTAHALFWCTATLPGGGRLNLADVVETAAQLVIVLATFSVAMSDRLRLARDAAGRMAPVLVALLLLSILYGVGAHAG